jgi:hypothetical protein
MIYTQYSGINQPNEVIIAVTVLTAVMIFIAIFIIIFKICLQSEQPIEIDAPPKYDGLDIVVIVPIASNYLTTPSSISSNLPPSYENALAGEEPPPYK